MPTRNLLPLTAALLLLAVLQCASPAAAAAAAGRSAAAPGLPSPLDANAVASEDATTAPRAAAAATTAAATTAVSLPAAAAARVNAADRSATVVFYNSTNVVSFRNGTDTTAVDENGRFSVVGLLGLAWASLAGFATALLFVPRYVVGPQPFLGGPGPYGPGGPGGPGGPLPGGPGVPGLFRSAGTPNNQSSARNNQTGAGAR